MNFDNDFDNVSFEKEAKNGQKGMKKYKTKKPKIN